MDDTIIPFALEQPRPVILLMNLGRDMEKPQSGANCGKDYNLGDPLHRRKAARETVHVADPKAEDHLR